MIELPQKDFERFKKSYLKALHNNQLYFMFDGAYIYIEFAKDVIKNYKKDENNDL